MKEDHDDERYHNWYHGFTKIELPHYDRSMWGLNIDVHTSASSGSVSTQNFGDKFDADSVELFFNYHVYIYPPESVKDNTNLTLHIEVERVPLETDETDRLRFSGMADYFNANVTRITENFTPRDHDGFIKLSASRGVYKEDVRSQKLTVMPGFRLRWHYSGIEMEPQAKYCNTSETKTFVRNGSITS